MKKEGGRKKGGRKEEGRGKKEGGRKEEGRRKEGGRKEEERRKEGRRKEEGRRRRRIGLKGAKFEIFTISSLHRELSPTRTLKRPGRNRARITCHTSSAYHVQRVVCHLVRKNSSAVKFDRV